MNSNATIGNANVGGVLNVTGTTTLSNVTVNSNANIGNSNVRGVLSVTGTTTLSNVTVNSNATIGNASVGGVLTVTGLTTLNGNILLSNVYLQKTSNISTTPITLSYPLYQTYNITSSSNTTITLPNIANGGNIVGITLNFFKSGSVSTIITIQSAGTDQFITNGTVTQSSTYTIPSGVTSSMLIACAGTPNYWTAIGGGGGGGSGSAGSFANIAINKLTVDSGYVMDVNGNAKISGNLVIGNGLTVSSGTVNFPSGSILTTAIEDGFVETTKTQTIGGRKTFTIAPIMSGANISIGTIPIDAVADGFVETTKAQTIAGKKTFTIAPVMSGASISTGTIPIDAVADGFVNTSTTQTIGGAKTFSVAPVMSGANISSASIPTSAVASGFVNTSSTQTIGGAKTFTGVNEFNNNFVVNCPNFIQLKWNSIVIIEIDTFSDSSPISISAEFEYVTFNYDTYFKSRVLFEPTSRIIVNGLTITPIQLSFLNNVSNGKIGQSQLTNGYVDLSSTQTIGGAKTFSVAPVMSGANISSGTIPTSAVASGFVDTSTTQTIGGAKTFSVAPVMSGANISSGTIPISAVASGFVDTSTTQTIGGVKTFSTAPVMSGANISSGTIPTSAVASGFVDTSTTQTIGGAKTFSVAPVMSGANISSGTITTTSLGFTFVDMSNVQTVGGAKTFSVAPTMSGANISSGTIPTSAVASGFVDTSSTQTIGGAKTFSGNVSLNGNVSIGNINLYQIANISTTPTTLSYPLSQTYNITSSSDTTITLPTIASGTSIIGDVINFFKSGSSTIVVTIQSASNTDKFVTNGTITQATTFTIPSGTTSAMLIACAGTTNYWTAIGGGGSGSTFSNIAVNKSTVDAGYVLDVSGNAKVSGNIVIGNGITVTGNASISGNVTAVSYNATSDRRLKANIQPLHSQWDSILSVEPVSFDWTVDGRTDIGFIAQDVYKSYPHLKPNYKTADPSFNEEEPVDLSGNPMYYTLDYGRMTPFLWQGMKEIMQKLDRLETENKKLVERIAVLESK